MPHERTRNRGEVLARLVSPFQLRHIPAFGIVAGSSSGQNVDWTAASFDRREVAKVGNAGCRCASSAEQKGSISANHAAGEPSGSQATVTASMPEHTLP